MVDAKECSGYGKIAVHATLMLQCCFLKGQETALLSCILWCTEPTPHSPALITPKALWQQPWFQPGSSFLIRRAWVGTENSHLSQPGNWTLHFMLLGKYVSCCHTNSKCQCNKNLSFWKVLTNLLKVQIKAARPLSFEVWNHFCNFFGAKHGCQLLSCSL